MVSVVVSVRFVQFGTSQRTSDTFPTPCDWLNGFTHRKGLPGLTWTVRVAVRFRTNCHTRGTSCDNRLLERSITVRFGNAVAGAMAHPTHDHGIAPLSRLSFSLREVSSDSPAHSRGSRPVSLFICK